MQPPAPEAGISARIQRLDHVGIATPDAAASIDLFMGLLGASLIQGGDNRETGQRIIQLALGGFKVELISPLCDDSPVAAFLATSGAGFHHLTLVVDDMAHTLSDLSATPFVARGVDLTSPHWREAYLSRRDTAGALVQLVETDLHWEVPTTEFTIDDVLAGRVVWRDSRACVQ